MIFVYGNKNTVVNTIEMPNPKRKEKIIKCKDICPLCAGPASFVKNNFNLQDIVYKHLHITVWFLLLHDLFENLFR